MVTCQADRKLVLACAVQTALFPVRLRDDLKDFGVGGDTPLFLPVRVEVLFAIVVFLLIVFC
jgi:hypothetical protein